MSICCHMLRYCCLSPISAGQTDASVVDLEADITTGKLATDSQRRYKHVW